MLADRQPEDRLGCWELKAVAVIIVRGSVPMRRRSNLHSDIVGDDSLLLELEILKLGWLEDLLNSCKSS
jgi:hypothetical protein